ncbi:MAG: PH domain-containing protein [Pirellulales bacterium]|nr:PH domain-containing protein [Pirellulales bacterium]
MNHGVENATAWVYEGVWSILSRWFLVPSEPPLLPVRSGEPHQSFRPAEGFLQYMKLQFWIGLFVLGSLVFFGWLVLTIASPVAGIIMAIPAFAVVILPHVVIYVALHLRYDTTWYVLSDKSLRIRRGIWVINETTITFENVQNVTVRQGPLQRWFGIWDVVIETAGGGGSQVDAQGNMSTSANIGLFEGVSNAHEIRDLILSKLRDSQTAGLGDEDLGDTSSVRSRPAAANADLLWTPRHVELLRQIRDEVKV